MTRTIAILIITIFLTSSCKQKSTIDLKKALANNSFLMLVENDSIPIEFIGDEVMGCSIYHYIFPMWEVYDSTDKQYLFLQFQYFEFEKDSGTTYFFSGNEFNFHLIKQDSIRFNTKFLEGVWVEDDFDFESWRTDPKPPPFPGPDASFKVPHYTFTNDSGIVQDRHYERPFTYRVNPIFGHIKFRGNYTEKSWQITSLDSLSLVYERNYINDSFQSTYQSNCKLKKVDPAKVALYEKLRSE